MTENNMTPEELIESIIEAVKSQYDNKCIITPKDIKDAMIYLTKEFGSQQFTAGVEAGKRESKWIPVEERLPEESEIVLVYFPSLVRIGYLFNGAWYKYHNAGPNDPLIWPSIIAWQPLPSPPNPDKGGKEKDNE